MKSSFPDLLGKNAIVTGAASGIGKAICESFLSNGVSVFGIDRVFPKGIGTGGKFFECGADLGISQDVKAAVEMYDRSMGSLDILVNSAGVELRGTVVDVSEEDYERVMNTNLKSIYLMCKYSIPMMLKTGKGSVINISSDLGLQPIPGVDIYAASKGAIISLSKGMSKNWAKSGMRINCILPGPVDTKLLKRFHSEETLKFVKEFMIPMGRLGTPEEIASIALFLASEQSSFVNGAAITANGGLLG
jgi:NAD(P)-dependent dehydrogenase (short-subunit alcohol dehydrogenase family)